MYEEHEILLDTFNAHTEPDINAADVLTRVEAIARTRRRNRWVVQATGVSMVTAGLVAGGIALPGLMSGNGHGSSDTVSAASGGGGDHTRTQALSAFFDAGYLYGDAKQLAVIWHETNITNVKAEAGQKLLDGDTLPISPSGQPVAAPDKDVEAFFNAGYDYNDAVTLAGVWHTTDTYQAKIKGGKKIEAGETLPIPPSSHPGASSAVATTRTPSLLKKKRMLVLRDHALANQKDGKAPAAASVATDGSSPALAAFFNAGYDYSDAQQLAAAWHETDINQVKAEAGQKLIDGEALPVPPSGQPAPPSDSAVSTFFADGYDYNDAVKLSSIWNVSIYHAKVEAGKKLQSGETLPVQP